MEDEEGFKKKSIKGKEKPRPIRGNSVVRALTMTVTGPASQTGVVEAIATDFGRTSNRGQNKQKPQIGW